ncbi:hypothetical protein CSUI_009688 [Cystoisospora suis]|uniref:Uncharacterized protein n=1 Tax=Cystoisospora suis TaxID=483139 RepID=A0A2C6KJ21_9APIC|nr:hypothetical protein CSUI_009688 [Cystoisospora suis]
MSRGFDARVASLRGSSSSLSSSFLSPSDVSFFERRQKREDTEREEKNMIKRMKMKKEDLSDLEVSKTKDTGEVYLEGEKGKEKHMTCLTPLSSSSPCNERERKKKELGENIGDRQQRDSSSSSPLFSSSPFSLPSYSSSLSLSSPVSSEVPSSASHEETFPSAVSLKSTGEKSLLTLSPPREEDKEEEEQTSEKDRVVSSLSSHSPRSENLVRRRKRRESIDRSSKVCREHLHKLKDEESPAIQGLQESKPLEEDEEEKDKKKRKMRKRASSFLSSSLSPLPEIASVMALSEEAVERNSLSPLELAHLLRLIDSLSLLDLPLPKHRHVLNSQQLAGQRSWLATPHDHPELAMRRQSRSSSIPVNRHRHSGLPFTRGDRIGRRRRQKTTSSCIVFSSSPSHRYSCDGEEHAEDLPLVLLSYEERCDLQSLLLLGDGEIRKAILACFLAYSSSSSLSSSPLSSFRSFHPHQQHDWRSFFLTLPSFLSKKERRKEMTNDMSSDLPACEGKTGSKEQAKEKKKEEETNPFPRDNEEKKASKTRERNFFRSFFSSFNVRKRESENSRRGDSEIGPSQRNGNLEKEDEDEEQKKKKEERTIFGKPYEAAGLHGERRGEQEEVVEEEEEERGSRRRRKEKIRERIERRKDEDRGSTLRLPQSQSGEKRRKEEIEEEERMSEGVDKKLFLSIQKRYVPLLLQGLRGILEEGKRRKRGRIKTR